MARKRPSKTSSGTKAASTRAKKNAAKKIARKTTSASAKGAKAAKSAKGAKGAKSSRSMTKAAPAAKKARAAKAARKAAGKKAAARTSARKMGARKVAKPAKKAGARASTRTAKAPAPAPRRTTPRISAGRRASPRKIASHEALAKKTLAKPTAAPRKPAKKRPAKQAPSTKASGKTARSRLVARKSQKLAPPVLRDTARRRVEKPTAPRPEAAAKPARAAPFRLHALGVREEHPTDRPRVSTLLAEAFARPDESAILDRLRADGDLVLALIAEFEGEIVGHVGFIRVEATIDGRDVKALALTPLAVTPARQGRGVGSVMIASGLEAARTAGFDAVFANGDATYFERFGFSAEAAAPFGSDSRGALTAIELTPGALSGERGTLRHAFDER